MTDTNNTTFKDAFSTLNNHAETLRRQTEPNIDDLLRIVNESGAAYQTCKARIDAVEAALNQALGAINPPSPVSSHGADMQHPD